MTFQKTMFLLFTICCVAFAQDKPRIAVYVASGELKDAEKKVLSTKILTPFVQSGQYRAIERGDAFLNNIARERQKQRDGSVDDNQISRLGKEAGIQFVCVADLVDAFGIYSVSARLIDVETAEIVGIGEAEMKSLGEIGMAATAIFSQITGTSNSKKQPVAKNDTATKKQEVKAPVSNKQSLIDLKKTQEYRDIKANFPNYNAYFDVAREAFEDYFGNKRNPRLVSRDENSLVIEAKWSEAYVKCTFFIDEYSQYIVVIETNDKYVDNKKKWITNVVSTTEKLGKKRYK
ncbi:MAG: penicillin-binding protein activator LpoB [Fibromonadales bacterium]|nr:penicillin-binding protein activator LpoB [Fibromonadales bacterium]